MKRILLAIVLALGVCPLFAGVTTYTFTSLKWASKVGATVCDGTTDGWISNKDATEYNAGRLDAQGRLYSCGVGVKTGTSGAGATSVITFEDVRRITFNFCQNSSKGRGTIYVQIGENEPLSIKVNKPATSGEGVYNRDSIISLETPQSGKIKFWVECTENAIYINTISIRSASGGSSVFTMDTYQLVTSVDQLQDSDQVIFGVAQDGVNYITGIALKDDLVATQQGVRIGMNIEEAIGLLGDGYENSGSVYRYRSGTTLLSLNTDSDGTVSDIQFSEYTE